MSEVKFTPVEPKKEKLIELTLSKKEANVLHAILSHVGGDKNGPRKHTDAVLAALADVTDPKIRAAYSKAITGEFKFA